jgi:hypothetical protein
MAAYGERSMATVNRAALDAGAGGLGDAGVAQALRPVAFLVRLVAHARAAARGRGARAARPIGVAGGERRFTPLRHGGCRSRGGVARMTRRCRADPPRSGPI